MSSNSPNKSPISNIGLDFDSVGMREVKFSLEREFGKVVLPKDDKPLSSAADGGGLSRTYVAVLSVFSIITPDILFFTPEFKPEETLNTGDLKDDLREEVGEATGEDGADLGRLGPLDDGTLSEFCCKIDRKSR